MNQQQQIEEMQTVINRAVFSDFKNGHNVCIKTLSEHLYNASYRKQSEVAREIFEEITKILLVNSDGEARLDVSKLYNIEKKYTEEREE